MKKYVILSLTALALSTASYAMDKLEIESGKTKIKMTLQSETPQIHSDELFAQKNTSVSLNPIDPASSSIKTLDDLAQYASENGKTLYVNTTSGLVPSNSYSTPINPVEEWKNDHIVGIFNQKGTPVKAVILKSHITGAYVDVTLPLNQK